MVHDQDLVSVQEVRAKVEQAYEAWQSYRSFSQAQVDAVVEAVAAKAREHARPLAQLAVEETGMGNVDDKVAKNLLNADLLPRSIRDMKTVGVLREIPEKRITEVGVPVGVVSAILPTTNPTSTAIYKGIIALKAGNAIVLSPHPRAKNCTCATASVMQQAATAAGAPAGLIQCITNPTLEGTNALMKHPRTGVILSTGGSGIVRAAYSSGKPAFGVGPGNVPILLDTSADVADAVAKIVSGKSFDYGTVCSSEQTLVAERGLRDTVLSELKARRAYLLSDQERVAVEKTLFTGTTTVRAECVGQSPQKIAQLAGFSVPPETSILVAEIGGVGKAHPLSAEKLSPVLAVLFVDTFEAAMASCDAILHFGGLGHTCVIHAKDEARVREFGLKMPAFRVLVNTPAPQGSVGITTGVQPSMTLGCGAMAGNITSDNIGPQHLINIKRIAWGIRASEEAAAAVSTALPVSVPLTAATSSPAAASLQKMTLIDAVEKYLASRGIAAASLVSSKPPEPTAASGGYTEPAKPVPPALAADTFPAEKPKAAPTQPVTAQIQPAAVPAPKIEIVDFVCESDVRAAIAQNRKIFIGPRTIVTPSARELAAPGEVLVMAQR